MQSGLKEFDIHIFSGRAMHWHRRGQGSYPPFRPLLLLLKQCKNMKIKFIHYFILFCTYSLGQGLVVELWILLATGVVPSCRGWVAGQP